MSNVIPFPASRIDLLCRAVAEAEKGPRELVEFEAHQGQVMMRVCGLELWMNPEEASELAMDLIEAAGDAKAKADV